MTLVLFAFGLLASAQETGEVNTETDTVPARPAETELLFDVAVDDAGDGQISGVEELPGVGFGDFVRVLIVLGIVIALIYGFVWMLKKFSGVKAEGGDSIRIFSTRPLKGDSAIHLVEAGNRIFLIGSSSNAINLISEIDDKESIDEIRLNASSIPAPIKVGFARLFKDRFGTGPSETAAEGESGSPDASPADPGSFLRKQRERLKDL